MRLRSRQPRHGHPDPAGISRPQEHLEHRPIYRVGLGPLQGPLERLSDVHDHGPGSSKKWATRRRWRSSGVFRRSPRAWLSRVTASLQLDQPQDNVAVALAGPAQGGELVQPRALDPDHALARGGGLAFEEDAAER